MPAERTLTMLDKILLAALETAEGDLDRQFTAEDLVVAAWEADELAFGLRGYEGTHPDSNKLYTKTDGRTGLVTRGYLQKVGERTFRLTTRGFAAAVRMKGGAETEHQAKLERFLQRDVAKILDHQEFAEWQRDSSRPAKFRGAGHFWGIAPGTPASVVRTRVQSVDQTLAAAIEELEARGLDAIVSQRGQPLFDSNDIERAMEFQRTLKTRFAKELRILDPGTTY